MAHWFADSYSALAEASRMVNVRTVKAQQSCKEAAMGEGSSLQDRSNRTLARNLDQTVILALRARAPKCCAIRRDTVTA